MTKFPDDQPLQFQACKVFNKLVENDEGLALFVKLRGVHVVVSNMKRFHSSEYLQARSSHLIYICSQSDAFLVPLKEGRATIAILEACENHPNSQVIRKWARPVFKTLLDL